MAVGNLNKLVRHVRSVALRQNAKEASDAELLRSYLAAEDGAAFEALVRRHGRMVLGVCRRVLHDPHDADDAFQATFLVLIRKAGTLRSPDMLSNWLYGVAYRSALQAKKAEAKRRAKEARVTSNRPTVEQAWADLLPHLDLELARLPDKYRAVLVACDLDGRSRKEVAGRIGLPEGTVASRLARARVMLARRMARHGLTLSGGALAMVLSRNLATAAAPAALVRSTVETAAAGAVPAKVAALLEGVLVTGKPGGGGGSTETGTGTGDSGTGIDDGWTPGKGGGVKIVKGERRLDKVRINILSLPWDQWNDIYNEVIDPLAKEGAEIHCQVIVIAQGEGAIRENTVELGIKESLSQRGIKAEIETR